jgi:hypothetical protein
MLVSTPNAKPAVLALIAIALAGCGNKPAEAPVQTATPAATTTPAAQVPAAAPAVPADFTLDKPIAGADIATSMSLIGAPVYRAKDDKVVFNVEVNNAGKSPLVSAGTMPVQIAVTLAGPDGVDKAPGVRNFVRTKLPLIQAASKARVQVVMPAQPMLGLTPRLELVQEGVAWFGKRWKQPTLDLGVFQRCNGAEGTLCDSAGVPVAQTH